MTTGFGLPVILLQPRISLFPGMMRRPALDRLGKLNDTDRVIVMDVSKKGISHLGSGAIKVREPDGVLEVRGVPVVQLVIERLIVVVLGAHIIGDNEERHLKASLCEAVKG